MKILYPIILFLTLSACQNEQEQPLLTTIETMKQTDVLLVSDHTLPEHLNLSSGGANGEERRFIDPTIQSLRAKLQALNLSTYVLNVEDMVEDKSIDNKTTFEAAYAEFDKVLNAAVAANVTILSVHYDANIIKAADYGSANDYIGGAHVILDQRATSNETIAFAESIIFDGNVLKLLNDTGLRIRPDYERQIRYQGNLTLNIIGHSKGGAALLEIGPQEQAQELFGTPAQIVENIDLPLTKLAETIFNFRQSNNLDN